MTRVRRFRRHPRAGLSLLEVLLALAILGGALAMIGELMRVGARNAEIARDLTTAQLIGETTMGELKVGFLPLQSFGPSPVADVEYEDEWLYTVNVQPIDQQGLVSVVVTVEQNPDIFSRPITFSLTRWLIDPSVAAMTTDTTASTTSGSTGTSGSTSTGGTNG